MGTLRELEERVQQWKTRMGRQLLEEALALQGEGKQPEGTCSCGGQWVFKGYRSQGLIRVKRAYFTCERCGQGFFPLDLEKGIQDGWSEKGLEQVLWIAQAEEALQRLALVGQYGGFWPRGGRKKRRSSGKAVYERRKFLLQRKGKRKRWG